MNLICFRERFQFNFRRNSSIKFSFNLSNASTDFTQTCLQIRNSVINGFDVIVSGVIIINFHSSVRLLIGRTRLFSSMSHGSRGFRWSLSRFLGVTSCPPPTWCYGPRKSML